MTDINIQKFLNNFNKQQMFHTKGTLNNGAIIGNKQNLTASSDTTIKNSNNTPNLSNQTTQSTSQNIHLNTLQNMDRSVYAKEVLGLPQNINEIIYMIQKGMTQAQFNQLFAKQLAAQRSSLSQMQAQILAQLQGLRTSTAKEIANIQLSNQLQSSIKNLEILSNGMINLNNISKLIQENGKDAITKLIMTMTDASKKGISDLSQMKDMAKLINASISIASENIPEKTLKLFIMLYLPWLPLTDGNDFDIEYWNAEEKSQDKISDSILEITVTTINYGIVKATLILESSNSVEAIIRCSKDFPKEELDIRVKKEQKFYSIQSTITYNHEQIANKQNHSKQSTNINTSSTNEINPYLLLMTHSIIKNIIEIDNNTALRVTPQIDI